MAYHNGTTPTYYYTWNALYLHLSGHGTGEKRAEMSYSEEEDVESEPEEETEEQKAVKEMVTACKYG